MNYKRITSLSLLSVLLIALLWVSLEGITLTAQGDPTAQQETVNAIVNARFTQTAQVLQERAVTLTVDAVFKNAMTATAALEATVQRQFGLNLTATANLEATVNAQMAAIQRTNVAATLAAGGMTLVTTNDQWIPQEQDFNGVTMVLVPPGCLMIGSDNGDDDEKPAHEVCFEQPFWIDKYEVTQAQFKQFGGKAAESPRFTGDSRPVEKITWFASKVFCAVRGARLPTEVEWEYAARGPDGLIYPWGNEFVADNVVYSGNSGSKTAPVGSKPGGVSWVGALDMSGNVWEWVSSLYQPYPYKVNDGRENISNTSRPRVLRGGGWRSSGYDLRTANRVRFPRDYWYADLGFRCVRPYQ